MKLLAILLSLSFAALAARTTTVLPLEASDFADMEAVTNIALVVDHSRLDSMRFVVELDGSATNCVEMWMSDLLNYPDGSVISNMSHSIQYKNSMLYMVPSMGLCNVNNIGLDVVDYVGRLRDIEEYAAPLVAATNAVLMNAMGLRASTDVETLQCAAQDIRVDMLPYLRQYWLSQPVDARSSCRSNIVERARLDDAEQHTVFSEP